MTIRPGVSAVFAALLMLPGAAQAQARQGGHDADDPGDAVAQVAPADDPDDAEADDPDMAQADETGTVAGAPAQEPPPMTSAPPPPPQAEQPSAAPRAPAGQWVDTQQYGWVWMPYSDSYTYAPPSGYGEPYEYVYYPTVGWTWVVAPWIWGWGPWPTFGFYGPVHFGWYGHGWWRTPSRWHYAPGHAGFYGGGSHRGFAGSGAVRGGLDGGFGGRGGGHGWSGSRSVVGGHASGGHVSGGRASGGHGGGRHGR